MRVLDAGLQPPSDLHPQPSDPEPDPEFPLVMVMCVACRLVQLESDSTTPEEPRGLEPRALVEQAEAAVKEAEAQGYVRPGIRVLEYPSPHGGSWVEQLERRSLTEVSEGPAELLVDIFGMMHEADQRAALIRRVSQMSPDAILLMQFHTVAAIVRSGFWNALRHGHFAYYSTPVLVRMAAELGLTARLGLGVPPLWRNDRVGPRQERLSLGRPGGERDEPCRPRDRRRRSRAHGRSLAERVACELGSCLGNLSRRLQGLAPKRWQGTAPPLARPRCCGVVASLPKTSSQSLTLRPDSMDAPCRAVASRSCRRPSSWQRRPDKVLLFVPDLLNEVRRALPEIELNGGRWVVLDPMPREIAPAATCLTK